MQLPNSIQPLVDITNKLPQQQIAKAICFILLIYIAFLCSRFTWLVIDNTDVSQVFPSKSESQLANKTKKQLSIKDILSLNLFGTYNEKPDSEIKVVEVQNAPETKLRLNLSATVVSDDATISAAIIEHNGKQETYGIGDNITGTRASLEQVFTDRILIKQSGKMETLMLDGFDYNAKSKTSNAKVSTQSKARSSSSKVPSRSSNGAKYGASPNVIDQRNKRNLATQAKNLKQDLAKDPGKITDYLKISPKRQDGQIVGYFLRPGKDPEFFKASGLKNGDVAIQMNGYDLKVPAEAVQALKALKEESEISLLVLRNEEITQILFSINE